MTKAEGLSARKGSDKMTEQLCPACGCHIAVDVYEKDGAIYYCQPCAAGGQYECGCCEVVEGEKEQESE